LLVFLLLWCGPCSSPCPHSGHRAAGSGPRVLAYLPTVHRGLLWSRSGCGLNGPACYAGGSFLFLWLVSPVVLWCTPSLSPCPHLRVPAAGSCPRVFANWPTLHCGLLWLRFGCGLGGPSGVCVCGLFVFVLFVLLCCCAVVFVLLCCCVVVLLCCCVVVLLCLCCRVVCVGLPSLPRPLPPSSPSSPPRARYCPRASAPPLSRPALSPARPVPLVTA
jgi:hypothetical protein